MQTQPNSHRFRGWRESKKFMDMLHAAPADLKEIDAACQQFENTYFTTRGLVDTISQQSISNIQHLRSQIAYRLKFDIG